jgi:hypothetical protein
MPVHSAQTIEFISQAKDKKKAIIEAAGNLNGVDVFSDLVLVGTYIEDEMTAGGIIKPKETVQESEFQGKVGLVLRTGPLAFGDWEEEADRGQNAKLHTWVAFAIKDTWPLQINNTACRVVPYEKLRMRVDNPTMVF